MTAASRNNNTRPAAGANEDVEKSQAKTIEGKEEQRPDNAQPGEQIEGQGLPPAVEAAPTMTDDELCANLVEQINASGINPFRTSDMSVLVKPSVVGLEQWTRVSEKLHASLKESEDAAAAQAAAAPAVFRCKSQVQFNGKVYEKGDEIPVTAEQAAAMPWAVEKA